MTTKLKVKVFPRFLADAIANAPLLLSKIGAIYTFSIDINALAAALANYFVAVKSVRTITSAGPQAALPTDDIIIIKQTVGAPFTLTVDWSKQTRSLQVVDGKGDAASNNISIQPASGQTQLAVVNLVYKIAGNGGSVILTPLPDGSGAY